MWELKDFTSEGRHVGKGNPTGGAGFLQIQLDGERVADIFPFAPNSNPDWLLLQGRRIVKAMNALDGGAAQREEIPGARSPHVAGSEGSDMDQSGS